MKCLKIFILFLCHCIFLGAEVEWSRKSSAMPQDGINMKKKHFILVLLPQLSLMLSFLILSRLVLSPIQRNILIFVKLNLFSCWFFTAQHPVPYIIAILITVHKIFPSTWAVLLYHIQHLRHSSISTTQLEFNGLHLLLFLCRFVLWTQDI